MPVLSPGAAFSGCDCFNRVPHGPDGGLQTDAPKTDEPGKFCRPRAQSSAAVLKRYAGAFVGRGPRLSTKARSSWRIEDHNCAKVVPFAYAIRPQSGRIRYGRALPVVQPFKSIKQNQSSTTVRPSDLNEDDRQHACSLHWGCLFSTECA